jgi:hypothetical protein
MTFNPSNAISRLTGSSRSKGDRRTHYGDAAPAMMKSRWSDARSRLAFEALAKRFHHSL